MRCGVCFFRFNAALFIDMTFNGFFNGLGQTFKYLLTPSWGSKRRAEQRAYEDRLDEAMNRVQAEKAAKAEG